MYTKLANSILTSTVWMESDQTRIVWLTLLAMCDKNGEVQASIPGLANVARVNLEDCEKAINLFLSPDPYSRTKTDEGRRIEEIEGGWCVLNHEKYRDLASDSDTKRKAAERQKRFRERQKRNGENVTSNAKSVTGRYKSHQNSHADTDADTELTTKSTPQRKQEHLIPKKLDDAECHAAARKWFSYLASKGLEDKSPEGNEIALEEWWRQMAKFGRSDFLEAVSESIAGGRWNVTKSRSAQSIGSKLVTALPEDLLLICSTSQQYRDDIPKRKEILGPRLFSIAKRLGIQNIIEAIGNDWKMKSLVQFYNQYASEV